MLPVEIKIATSTISIRSHGRVKVSPRKQMLVIVYEIHNKTIAYLYTYASGKTFPQ